MKKLTCYIMLLVMLFTCITGCGTCNHMWSDGDCDSIRTCSICNKTESEPQGHDMTDANYQTPATCKTCGYTEGTVLTPDAERYDMTIIEPAIGAVYDCTLTCYEDDHGEYYTTVGKLMVSKHETFESAEGYETLDGYEWHKVSLTITFGDENAWNYGVLVNHTMLDYYQAYTWEEAGNDKTTFSVNYNGIDYDNCMAISDYRMTNWNEETYTIAYIGTFAWRVPVGYDGIILCFCQNIDADDNQCAYEVLTKDNAILLRFAN